MSMPERREASSQRVARSTMRRNAMRSSVATVASSSVMRARATSALRAWGAAGALGDQENLLWLAAIGLIGDMADEAGFPELAQAQGRWGKTALKDAVSLINAPRRTAAADPWPAARSARRAADILTAWKGREWSEDDVWSVLFAVKMARAEQGAFHADDYIDLCGYAALMAECRAGLENA